MKRICVHTYRDKYIFLSQDGVWQVAYGVGSPTSITVDMETALTINPNFMGLSWWALLIVALAHNRGISLDQIQLEFVTATMESFRGLSCDSHENDYIWWSVAWRLSESIEGNLKRDPLFEVLRTLSLDVLERYHGDLARRTQRAQSSL